MAIDSPADQSVDLRSLPPVPGRTGLPIIGETLRVISGELYQSRERYDRYGPVSRVRAFGRTGVLVEGPDATAEVLLNRDRAFASGPGWGYLIGPFFKRGLMLLDFDEHHLHRRIMQEAFTSERLAGYLQPMNETLARGLGTWRIGDRFLVYPAVKQLILDVATRTFMGGVLGQEADAINSAFVDCVRAPTSVIRMNVPGLRWSRGLAARRLLEDYLYPQLPAKRAGDGNDLFSALCHARGDDGEGLSDDDVINHMIFLLMAAHDTTTISMTTMAYYLGRHPEWQERCREESLALDTPHLAFHDIDRLVSLDLVMRESVRLLTPVPGIARKTVADTAVAGHFIPKGTHVSLNMHLGHHLAEFWPDPERFDPGRFSEERREDRINRNAWMPFGHGVHKCLGMHFGMMQIKATLHQILLRYRWQVPTGYEMPIDWTSLPRPKDGLPVRLERR